LAIQKYTIFIAGTLLKPIKAESAENAYLSHGRMTNTCVAARQPFANLIIIPLMKKNVYLLFLLGLLVWGCEPKEITFTYGKDGVVFPDAGKVKPTFNDGEAKGSFLVYPAALDINSTTGEVDFASEKTIPGYRYVITFISADGKKMAHTYVTVAGIRYPSRYFDIDNPDDVVAKPLMADNSAAIADSEFSIEEYAISDVVPSTNFAQLRQQKPTTDTAVAVRQLINARDGSVNVQQLVQNIFGSAISGKIELNIRYGTTQYGRKITGQTKYTLFRQDIINKKYRDLIRFGADFDRIIKDHQTVIMTEKNTGNIRGHYLQGSIYDDGSFTKNHIFRFTAAKEIPPPPSPTAAAGRGAK